MSTIVLILRVALAAVFAVAAVGKLTDRIGARQAVQDRSTVAPGGPGRRSPSRP